MTSTTTNEMVKLEIDADLALVRLSNPPVNCTSLPMRIALMQAIESAERSPEVKAIILTGEGKVFCAGGDLGEFDSGDHLIEPTLNGAIPRFLDDLSKPIVAAVNGAALAGGLELALACHYRVAASGARMGLPEVTLGLIPGAGGTVRLPRAVGLEAALNMIVSGKQIDAQRAKEIGLLDEVIEGDLIEGAKAFARSIATIRPIPRLRDRKIEFENADAFLDFAADRVKANANASPSAHACVKALANAVSMDFDTAIREETRLFEGVVQEPDAQAARHIFFAERQAAKPLGISSDVRAREIKSACVVGAGFMGTGIAICFLNAGIPTTIIDTTEEALTKGVGRINDIFDSQVKRNRLSEKDAHARLSLLSTSIDPKAAGQADIIVEAVFENLDIKKQVFRTLDEVAKPGAILATNTSGLDIDQIASVTKRPSDVVGTHFFSPANVMRLLEVVRASKTSSDVLLTVSKLAAVLRKTAVFCANADGFIGNRILEEYLRQAFFLLDEGATPSQVDRALERWGMAMGPFRMLDVVGNDIVRAMRERRYVTQPHVIYSRIADKLCDKGWLGQKSGRGWYKYEEGRRDAIPDPEVVELIEQHSASLNLTRLAIPDVVIVNRCILALVNESAKVLDEAIADRGGDIDVVFTSGYGFPKKRGGPLFYADTVGLYEVIRLMRGFQSAHGDQAFWEPHPLIVQMASEKRRISEYSRSK